MGISQFLTVAANTASGNPERPSAWLWQRTVILVFGVLVLLYLLITLEGIIFTSVDRRKKRRACSEERSGSRSGESGCSEGSGCGSRHPGRGRRGHCRRYRLHGRRRTLYAAQC